MSKYFLLIFALIFYLKTPTVVSDLSVNFDSFFEDLVQVEDEKPNNEPLFGGLYTQEDVDRWTEKEEEIIQVLEKKLELIDEEIMLIEEYLEDYDESTGEAMRHLREPKETPEERGKVVGSSAVLGHRMTSRYAGIISQIRRFLTSDDYLDNEEQLARILEETEEEYFDEATNTTKRLYPGSEELYHSMLSFFEIQHSQGLRPSQLIYGSDPNQNNHSQEVRLNALQCAEIGVFALFRKEYQYAIEWLEMSKDLLVSGQDDEEDNLPVDMVSILIRLAIEEHNRAYRSGKLGEPETSLNFYVEPVRQFGERIPIQIL